MHYQRDYIIPLTKISGVIADGSSMLALLLTKCFSIKELNEPTQEQKLARERTRKCHRRVLDSKAARPYILL